MQASGEEISASLFDMSTSIVFIAGRAPEHRVKVPQSFAVQCVAVACQLGDVVAPSCPEDRGDVSLSDDDDDDDKDVVGGDAVRPTSGGDCGGDCASACSSAEFVVDAGKSTMDLAIRFLWHHNDTLYSSPDYPLKPASGAHFDDAFDNVSAQSWVTSSLQSKVGVVLVCLHVAELRDARSFRIASSRAAGICSRPVRCSAD